jgi:hypothetical protein
MHSNTCQLDNGTHSHTQHQGCTLDSLGIFASVLCMVHCAAMPFLMAVLPVVGMSCLQGHFAHQILAFFVVTFACAAVLPAYLKHRNTLVLGLMLAGVSIVLFATFGAGSLFPDSYELPLITCGNLLVVFAHWRNIALRQRMAAMGRTPTDN